VKAPIKIDRCMPVVAQSHGCGVCMKVCPIQRYGLERVTEHLMLTGTILGKGSDELEGYDWVNGRHYGPGEKPRIDADLIHPPDLVLDPTRRRPQAGAVMSNMVPKDVSGEDLRG
jgi:hypothetical protein